MAAMLLKKLFVDKRKEEEGMWQLAGDDYMQLKNAITGSLDFVNTTVSNLRRKADLVCACYKESKNYTELILSLVQLIQEGGEPRKRVYAMYIFELLSEYHLPQDQIVSNSDQFIQLFTGCLKDESADVKVAALKAIAAFLSKIEDESVVLKYQSIMDFLLDVVIEVLRQDEDRGKASLESLIELTQNSGEIWSLVLSKLLYIVAQVV
jgi:hypothetical protein